MKEKIISWVVDHLLLVTIGCIVLMTVCLWLFLRGSFGLVSTIESPVERGAAYIAFAIVIHCFFGGKSS